MLVRPRNFLAIAVAAPLLMLVAAPAAAHGGAHWSYSGSTGPAKWASLEKDFGSCALGRTQSPIDIHDSAAKKADLPAIIFDYKPAPLKIIDNGHTIQVNYAPGSFITVGGKQFELVQFHFHKPSEEKVNGKNYDMVAHLVHKDTDGNLAVVAVLLKKGSASPLVKTLWDNLPKQKGHEMAVDAVTINIADLLPGDKAYYTFAGSLTTPPCSENVTWFVLKNPSSISSDEIARFAKSYPMNARPVQPLNGREIKTSN
ncbi:MAG TPA: carbonic anhydrase family protein [Burkholderiaceae bacterium]|nr:carbonic anhydrase family protein [Burkholderiaceae bacterium]